MRARSEWLKVRMVSRAGPLATIAHIRRRRWENHDDDLDAVNRTLSERAGFPVIFELEVGSIIFVMDPSDQWQDE